MPAEPRPWIRDFAPVAGAFALCPAVALAHRGAGPEALERGRAVAALERGLGLAVEPAAYAAAAGSPTRFAVLAALYLGLHVTALLGALAWCYLRRPAAFPRARALFLATQGVVVAGWLALPVAPPRMVDPAAFPVPDVPGWATAGGGSWVQSGWAAMPSGHVAFAAVVGLIGVQLARGRAARGLAATYPAAVGALVVATGHHFWLDAVAGLLAVALAAAGVAGARAARGALGSLRAPRAEEAGARLA